MPMANFLRIRGTQGKSHTTFATYLRVSTVMYLAFLQKSPLIAQDSHPGVAGHVSAVSGKRLPRCVPALGITGYQQLIE